MNDEILQLTDDEIEAKLKEVTAILGELHEKAPGVPLVFFALGPRTKYLNRDGHDYIQLGMLAELQTILTLPSAQAFHAMKAARDAPRIVKPGVVPFEKVKGG